MKYLAACCTVKNEESIITEWMAFHRSSGIEHLIIVDNGSTDSTASLIKSFPDQRSITYIDWSRPGSQTEMYEAVLRECGDQFEWCAFIDADEFLYPSQQTDLRLELCHFGAAGVGVHWHIFGSSGHLTKQEGLVLSNYTHRANDDYIYNRHIKSIIRPKACVRAVTSHMFELDGPFVDENGNNLAYAPPFGYFENMPVTHNKLRINHYHTRSRQEYEQKAMRGYFGIDDSKLTESKQRFEEMFSSHDMNEVFDDSAEKYKKLVEAYISKM